MPDFHSTIFSSAAPSFLSGGGEMGELIRSKDWSGTSLGEPVTWPQSLRTTIGIVLNSKFPMFLFWGPQLLCFYNDAYRPSLGINGKHPAIVGMPGEKAWAEIWTIIKTFIDEVLQEGKVVWREDQLIPIYRNGTIEDVYWTFSYSPVNDESEKPGGVLVICSETTEKITGQKIAANLLTETEHTTKAQKKFINSFNESEKKFRNTVMQAPVGIIVLRKPDFIVEMANETYLGIIGKKEEEFVGRPLFDSLPEIRESVEALLSGVLTAGIAYNSTEFPVPLNRFGKIQTAYFNFSYQALKEDDGIITGVIVIANEVTSLVKAKYSLAESEKHFRNMVMQSPIPMAILRGSDYVIETANIEMFKNIWRKEEADILGKNLLDVFPELIQQKYPELLARVYTTGEVFSENESVAYVQGDDGMKIFYLDYEYAPLFETDGSVSGIMITVNNVTEKVETRLQLEVEETRLRLATEGTRLGTWDLNLQTKHFIHSPRLAEIFGHPSSALLKHKDVRGLIHPEDLHTVVEAAFEEAIKTSVYHYEARVIKPDKTECWIRTQGKVIYSDTKLPLRMIGTTVDITDSKVNVEEIARLAAIVQSSEDSIISENLDGIITSWNDAAERMFGYTANELIGEPIATLIPEDRMDEEKNILAQVKSGNGLYSFETRRLKKDHTILDISLTISPVKDGRGNIIGASKIARDITKQKQIEKQITASEERFRLLANSMAQLIWTGDADGNFNYYNQAVKDYARMTFEEFQSEGWLKIVHPDEREENRRKWKHAIATGEDFITEHRFCRHDGEYRWQLSRALPQKDSNGKIQMWVGTSTDIHEIKENEQQKDFFISMASHELKTPVTSIKGYVQILMSLYNDKGDDFLKNSLQTVNKQIVTLTTLIVDLLDLSKIKSGSLQLNKERFCVNELISEIVKELQHTEPGCAINVAEITDAVVYADRGRIGQVLINFLTNAIKYSPNCKEIQVSSKVKENELTVAVTDSGIGISKADQQKIFQRFYRVAGKDEKTFPGFGIGLFIASEIIQRHNGKIGVQSEPGKGSEFYFSLPLDK
jgi:PAS domain S-box-containing protein